MADESYWTYRAGTQTPDYSELSEGTFKGTRKQWESLSPGMRREIARDARRRSRCGSGDLFAPIAA